MRTDPGFANVMTPNTILAITLGILIGLFAIQSHGTASIARLFGTRRDSVAMADLAASLANRPPKRCTGTAVFLTSDPQSAPSTLLHNLKHNQVLHAHNIILKVATGTRPRITAAERLTVRRVDDNFSSATLHYGYMENADIPIDLGLRQVHGGISYFVSRNTVNAQKGVGMPFIQDMLFLFLQTNSSNPTAFFQIPPNRVLELGSQVRI